MLAQLTGHRSFTAEGLQLFRTGGFPAVFVVLGVIGVLAAALPTASVPR